jgi:Mrp family chromosome partitioning ATPase
VSTTLSADREPNLAFQGILNSVFQGPEEGEGIVIAFTSANPGEGVSYVSHKIASQLSATCSGVRRLSSAELLDDFWPHSPNRYDGFAKTEAFVPRTGWDNWRGKVMQLRARNRYSVIDCPSLAVSGDVLSLAPHLDGIVVVVAANETHKTQVANVERQIQMVNGKILGYLLNKRKYMVPDWLYKRL